MNRATRRDTPYVTGAPVTNSWGEGANFDYTVAGPNGQTGTATVAVSLEHVNAAPTLDHVDHTARPICAMRSANDGR